MRREKKRMNKMKIWLNWHVRRAIYGVSNYGLTIICVFSIYEVWPLIWYWIPPCFWFLHIICTGYSIQFDSISNFCVNKKQKTIKNLIKTSELVQIYLFYPTCCLLLLIYRIHSNHIKLESLWNESWWYWMMRYSCFLHVS